MPRFCNVMGCKRNYGSRKGRFSTFSLPKDEDLRKKWLLNIPNDISGLKNPCVCERHFKDEEIIRIDKVLDYGVWKEFPRISPKLKAGAIPSIFSNFENDRSLPKDNCGDPVENPSSEDVIPLKANIIHLSDSIIHSNASDSKVVLKTYPRNMPEMTGVRKKFKCVMQRTLILPQLKDGSISSLESSMDLQEVNCRYPVENPVLEDITPLKIRTIDLRTSTNAAPVLLTRYLRKIPETSALRKKPKCVEHLSSIDTNNLSSTSPSSKVLIPDDSEVCLQKESDDAEPCSFSSYLIVEQKAIKQFKSEVSFSIERITDDDTMYSVTGFNVKAFHALFQLLCLEDLLEECQLSPLDQFFLMTVYLKTGLSEEYLAFLYQIEHSIVPVIIRNTAIIVYDKLKKLPIWPSREVIQKTTPLSFSKKYPNCRIIIDCIEFNVQTPSSPLTREELLNRKNIYTIKGMIGITPCGTISFISDSVGGSISDKNLFLSSGILDLLQPGDFVLADKGFNIKSELAERGCQLVTLNFCNSKCSSYEKKEDEAISLIEKLTSQFRAYKYFGRQIEISSVQLSEKFFFIVAFFLHFLNPLEP